MTENGENKIIKNKFENIKNYLGIIIVLLITIFLTTANEVLKSLISNNYNVPFVIVWFNFLYLIIPFIGELLYLKYQFNNERKLNYNNIKSYKEMYLENFKIETITNENGEKIKKGITFKKLLIISFPMSILFVGLNWIWMKALPLIECSISTTLFQIATLSCYIFSIIILKEKIRLMKTISVIVFVLGVIGVGLATYGSSPNKYPNELTGYILIIFAGTISGLYEVLTSKLIGGCNRTVVHTYMGLIATYHILWGIPIIYIFNITGFERFYIPDIKTFGLLCFASTFCFIGFYLINFGLSVTSPLFVNAGQLMSIPSTLLVDIIIKNISIPLTSIPGYLFIVIGFFISVYVEYKKIKENTKKDELKKLINNN